VKPVANHFNERGVFSIDELKALFSSPGIWPDFRHYALNLTTASCGLRMGEIRGLSVHDVHRDFLSIVRSWEEGYGMKEPKMNSRREVPISGKVFEVLDRVIHEAEPEGIVFYSDTRLKGVPLAKTTIEKVLYATLDKIGIDEVQRKQRNLSFHCFRHSLNTVLRSRGISDVKVREITGHRSEKMSDHYTHFHASDFKEVLKITEEFTKEKNRERKPRMINGKTCRRDRPATESPNPGGFPAVSTGTRTRRGCAMKKTVLDRLAEFLTYLRNFRRYQNHEYTKGAKK
jgi:hypothetical protein